MAVGDPAHAAGPGAGRPDRARLSASSPSAPRPTCPRSAGSPPSTARPTSSSRWPPATWTPNTEVLGPVRRRRRRPAGPAGAAARGRRAGGGPAGGAGRAQRGQAAARARPRRPAHVLASGSASYTRPVRIVFAGTPETALPTLDALLASRHEVAAVLTRPDAAVRTRTHAAPSPVAEHAAAHGHRGADAGDAVRPGVPRPAARHRPGLLPDRGVRRPAAPRGARHSRVRLDQPALLGAARLARSRPGAAVDHGRRRGHRSHRVQPGRGARRRPGPRHDHRAHPRRRHGRHACSTGSPGRVPRWWSTPSTTSRTATSRAHPQPEDGVSYAAKLTTDDARVDWNRPAFAVDRQIRGCTPDPGAWTMLGGRAAQARPGPRRRRRRRWSRAGWTSASARCGWAPRRRTSCSATCSRSAASGCRQPTGRRGTTFADAPVLLVTDPVRLVAVRRAARRRRARRLRQPGAARRC